MKPTDDRREPPAQRGFLGRFRALPGSRAAVVAFVLTIALGAGGTAAYAWWSQTGSANITATAGAPTAPPTTPPPTTPPPTSPPPTTAPPTPGGPTAIAPNVQTAWAGRPAASTCARVNQSDPNTIGMKFSWPTLPTATSYVVSVKTHDGNYVYTKPAQEVTSPEATFIFPEGNDNAAFYTRYLVRVMPMNGAVGGDPTYFIFQHARWETNTCFPIRAQDVTAVMPMPRAVLSCSLSGLNNTSSSADVPLAWTSVAGATSYRISVRPFIDSTNKSSYGADIVSTGTAAVFRYDIASQAGTYLVRVQPMNDRTAGDPTYIVYQLDGPWSHHCRPQDGAVFQ